MLHATAREERGQLGAAVPGARPWGRGRGGRRRGRLGLQRLRPARELQQELRGIELLGASPVEVPSQERELVTELLDELVLLAQLGEQLHAVLLQVGGIGGQPAGGRTHPPYRCAARRERCRAR